MKSFFQFLNEATQSKASMQARKLNLKSDGHGGWLNTRGELIARTEKGKFKFIDRKTSKGVEEPTGEREVSQTSQKQETSRTQAQVIPQSSEKSQQSSEKQSEEDDSVLTVVFGRFNPPTVGHQKLLSVAKTASAGGDLKIYPSRTQDPKKNPLNPDIKVSYMKKMFPDFEENIINDSNMKSIFDVLINANEEGYKNVNIVVGSDRQTEFENLANKYNGNLYNFDLINVISAGVRDSDAPGVEGMSASKMRKAVVDDDFKTFRRGTPKILSDADTRALFNSVRQGMNFKKKREVVELWKIAPKYDQKTLRENYVKGNIFKIGEIVESLNTGLVGEIIRRGTNYLICLTKEEYVFKPWIKDVMEYTEKKMNKKERLPGKPNTLVGTSGYFKYAADMTPGFEEGDETNLQSGAKPYKGYSHIKEFINKYKKIKKSIYSNV
jgi:nicotinamide mononucleotide adenylyltransferase